MTSSTVMRAVMLLTLALLCPSAIPSTTAGEHILLADPKRPLDREWVHKSFGRATDYEQVTVNGIATIRAIGRDSASGLYRETRYPIRDHPWLEWIWRVDRLQETADLRIKAREDFAAAIFLIFGRPSMLRRNMPTLAYVWTNDRLARGSVVDSPHHPGVVRSLVIRSGKEHLGRWLRERRNVVEDFRRVFGREPPDRVEVLALFTDNDQTGEPVEVYYGAIAARPR